MIRRELGLKSGIPKSILLGLRKTHHVGLGQNLQRDMFGDEHPFIYLLFCGSPGIPCVLTHTHEDHPNQFQMGPRFALER